MYRRYWFGWVKLYFYSCVKERKSDWDCDWAQKAYNRIKTIFVCLFARCYVWWIGLKFKLKLSVLKITLSYSAIHSKNDAVLGKLWLKKAQCQLLIVRKYGSNLYIQLNRLNAKYNCEQLLYKTSIESFCRHRTFALDGSNCRKGLTFKRRN